MSLELFDRCRRTEFGSSFIRNLSSAVVSVLLAGSPLVVRAMETMPEMPMAMLPADAMATRNKNGVVNMYGMSTSGMKMQMSTADPERMPSTIDVGTPMTREGSGTAWMPDATPVYGHMWNTGDDMQMTHAALFLRYMSTGSARGTNRVVVPGWFMYMRNHPLSPNSQIGLRGMFTPDPATVGGGGYPALFQSGETWHGRALHDTQHPHDLVSELAASYSVRFNKVHSGFVYFGYPGEPALGPPTFMHRPIAYDFSSAPISHHWQDSTHITFGVLTAGISSTKFRVEGSSFTGREPNEVRTNFDRMHLDSSSGRLSWNPNRYVSTQISYGFIKSPESTDPALNLHRTTASMLYERPLDARRAWSQALVFGQNSESDGQHTSSYIYESDYRIADNAYFARLERVQKSNRELVLPAAVNANVYTLTTATIGMVHNMPHTGSATVTGVGFDLTYNLKPSSLSPYYGYGNPFGFEVFYRLRPACLPGQRTTLQ